MRRKEATKKNPQPLFKALGSLVLLYWMILSYTLGALQAKAMSPKPPRPSNPTSESLNSKSESEGLGFMRTSPHTSDADAGAVWACSEPRGGPRPMGTTLLGLQFVSV